MISLLSPICSLRKSILHSSPLFFLLRGESGYLGHDGGIMDNELVDYAVHSDTLILVMTAILEFELTYATTVLDAIVRTGVMPLTGRVGQWYVLRMGQHILRRRPRKS
jgi:hypothetical protein